jgi:hypothetical protein
LINELDNSGSILRKQILVPPLAATVQETPTITMEIGEVSINISTWCHTTGNDITGCIDISTTMVINHTFRLPVVPEV